MKLTAKLVLWTLLLLEANGAPMLNGTSSIFQPPNFQSDVVTDSQNELRKILFDGIFTNINHRAIQTAFLRDADNICAAVTYFISCTEQEPCSGDETNYNCDMAAFNTTFIWSEFNTMQLPGQLLFYFASTDTSVPVVPGFTWNMACSIDYLYDSRAKTYTLLTDNVPLLNVTVPSLPCMDPDGTELSDALSYLTSLMPSYAEHAQADENFVERAVGFAQNSSILERNYNDVRLYYSIIAGIIIIPLVLGFLGVLYFAIEKMIRVTGDARPKQYFMYWAAVLSVFSASIYVVSTLELQENITLFVASIILVVVVMYPIGIAAADYYKARKTIAIRVFASPLTALVPSTAGTLVWKVIMTAFALYFTGIFAAYLLYNAPNMIIVYYFFPMQTLNRALYVLVVVFYMVVLAAIVLQLFEKLIDTTKFSCYTCYSSKQHSVQINKRYLEQNNGQEELQKNFNFKGKKIEVKEIKVEIKGLMVPVQAVAFIVSALVLAAYVYAILIIGAIIFERANRNTRSDLSDFLILVPSLAVLKATWNAKGAFITKQDDSKDSDLPNLESPTPSRAEQASTTPDAVPSPSEPVPSPHPLEPAPSPSELVPSPHPLEPVPSPSESVPNPSPPYSPTTNPFEPGPSAGPPPPAPISSEPRPSLFSLDSIPRLPTSTSTPMHGVSRLEPLSGYGDREPILSTIAQEPVPNVPMDKSAAGLGALGGLIQETMQGEGVAVTLEEDDDDAIDGTGKSIPGTADSTNKAGTADGGRWMSKIGGVFSNIGSSIFGGKSTHAKGTASTSKEKKTVSAEHDRKIHRGLKDSVTEAVGGNSAAAGIDALGNEHGGIGNEAIELESFKKAEGNDENAEEGKEIEGDEQIASASAVAGKTEITGKAGGNAISETGGAAKRMAPFSKLFKGKKSKKAKEKMKRVEKNTGDTGIIEDLGSEVNPDNTFGKIAILLDDTDAASEYARKDSGHTDDINDTANLLQIDNDNFDTSSLGIQVFFAGNNPGDILDVTDQLNATGILSVQMESFDKSVEEEHIQDDLNDGKGDRDGDRGHLGETFEGEFLPHTGKFTKSAENITDAVRKNSASAVDDYMKKADLSEAKKFESSSGFGEASGRVSASTEDAYNEAAGTDDDYNEAAGLVSAATDDADNKAAGLVSAATDDAYNEAADLVSGKGGEPAQKIATDIDDAD